MVAKLIYRIPVADLNTIRVVIKGVATEFPLDADKVKESLQRQKLSDAAIGSLLALVDDLATAQRQISDDLAIEFVIPDPQK